MKYIRVIDDLDNEYLTTYKEHCEMVAELQDSGFDFEGGIINQADTIEELCDEFVDTSELKTTNTGGWLYDEFDSKNKCLVYYVEDERRTIPLNEFEDLSKIYGAIWTDKGLIYVAKMNEKGDMELL